ncbi:TPA: IS1 family transposase [Photobacterium damselae]
MQVFLSATVTSFVHKTIGFSKTDEMHDKVIELYLTIHNYQ